MKNPQKGKDRRKLSKPHIAVNRVRPDMQKTVIAQAIFRAKPKRWA